MPSAATIRAQVEAALADRIPSALRIAPRAIRPVLSSGIRSVDSVLDGGLPVGAITEIVGAECSGRTCFTLSFLGRLTQAGKVCAWIDVSNALQPESAAAAGVQLSRMLWVRCWTGGQSQVQDLPQQKFALLPGKYLIPPPAKQGLHGGGCGAHPRTEVKGLSEAVSSLLRPDVTAPRPAPPFDRVRTERAQFEPNALRLPSASLHGKNTPAKPWSRIDQALRVADLLLQAGGFSAIVLDMAGVAPEFSSRVPLATWFRFRAAAEKSQTSVLLLTQHACAKTSAELVLQIRSNSIHQQQTVFTGVEHQIEVSRQRIAGGFGDQEPTNVIPLRKPPQRAMSASFQASTAWAGRG
jgi:recombination protein RecA